MTKNLELSRRPALDGGINTQGGSHSAGTQYNPHAKTSSSPAISSLGLANLAPLTASFYSSAVAPFKFGKLAQTLIDVLASIVVFLFLIMVALSLPLSLFLMVLGVI